MEPGVSIPPSQNVSNNPYPESKQSISSNWHLFLYGPPTYARPPKVLFPGGLLLKIFKVLLSCFFWLHNLPKMCFHNQIPTFVTTLIGQCMGSMELGRDWNISIKLLPLLHQKTLNSEYMKLPAHFSAELLN